jgi:hypothetical protein
LYTATFWKDAFERAVKTGVQAVLLFLGADQLFDAVSADWGSAGSFFLGGFILSVLTSLVSAPVGTKGTASLVKSE